MNHSVKTWIVCAGMLAVAGLVGCGPSEEAADPPGTKVEDDHSDHAGHDHATTFEGAVKELAGMKDTIAKGFESGDVDAAHGPLHEVGHVLENLEEFSKTLPEEKQAAAKTAVTKLFDLFEKVDLKLHGKEGADYKDVAADIDAGLAELTSLVEDHGDGHAEHGDEHKDGDHKEEHKDGGHKEEHKDATEVEPAKEAPKTESTDE